MQFKGCTHERNKHIFWHFVHFKNRPCLYIIGFQNCVFVCYINDYWATFSWWVNVQHPNCVLIVFFWYSQTPEGNILGLCSCEMFYLIYVLLFVVRFNICWAFWIKIATTMQLEMMLMLKRILKLKESAKNLCQNADLIDCSSFKKKKSLLVPDRALITKDYKKWQKYKKV